MKKLARKPGAPGVEVKLGRVIASGGEGKIHEIEGRKGFVAKVYHQPPGPEKTAKLEAMVAASTETLLEVAAWPVELLRGRPGGPPIGVVMPRVDDHQDVHLLYGPRSRLSAFPLAGWPFLIRTAANLARAFAVVHAHGHVIGDVNDRVALVSGRALVRLIDCDGFQVRHHGRTFACDVGVLTHQPPELQGVSSFRGLLRGENHDHFGLAVLIFQLLFMARHPFSGSYGRAGDMPLERAIREHRFVYGAQAAKRGMQPPPAAMDLGAVSRDVARLFEQAFSPHAAKDGRPKASEWVEALDELARLVRPCRTNPLHAFLKGRSCPFCAIDRQTDLALFNFPLFGKTKSGGARAVPVHLPNLWKEIGSIDGPGPASALPAALLECEREHAEAARRRARRWKAVAATVLVALGLALPTRGFALGLLLLLPLFWPRRAADPARAKLGRRARELVRRWNEDASARPFEELLGELKRARAGLDGLEGEHDRARAELEARRRQSQLDAFLRKQRIADAELGSLDRGAKAVLESYGIETADEVSEPSLSRVSSLREPARKELLEWRKEQESRFLYDPARGVAPEALEALERSTRKRRADLVQTLVDGPARLRHAAQEIHSARQKLHGEVERLVREIGEAGARK